MNVDDLIVPRFASEREEAEWWEANPDFVLKLFERAKANGTLGNGSVKRRLAAQEAAKAGALKLDSADLSLANRLAERKGIERDVYLKDLVHAALLREAEALGESSAA
jgi:hypothetical protein